MVKTVHPTILWAQRSSADEASKNIVYLTIEVTDPTNTKLELTSTKLDFTADSVDKETKYELSIEFFDEIDTENSRQNLENGSHIFLVLRKKAARDEFWPRLTKEKLKYHFIKTDFDKWVDEDEQDEEEEKDDDMANMMGMGGPGGPGGMGGMPGMGGMGGMEGMGGMGGMGGMDLSKLMQGMGGGAGGGDFDISALASQLGQAGGADPAGESLGEDGADKEEEVAEVEKET